MPGRAEHAPEFSRVVEVDEIGPNGRELTLAAEPGERAALARRFGLEDLTDFEGKARLTALGEGRVRLKVTFSADVIQSCVITLDPVASHISDQFEVTYAPVPRNEDDAEVVIDMDAEDPPEALLEGKIDIGEMMAQHLAMQIDPYPRAPDAGEASWRSEVDDDTETSSAPFEKLKQWRHRA